MACKSAKADKGEKMKNKNIDLLIEWYVKEDERKKKRRNNILTTSLLLIVMSGIAFFSFFSGYNAGVENGVKMAFSPFYFKGLNAGRGMPRSISAVHHSGRYKIIWAISVVDGDGEKKYFLLEKERFRIFFQLNNEEAKKISDFSAGMSEIYIENGKIKNIFFDFTICNFFRLSDGEKKVFQYCRSE
ncbi:MAG: hypothetical protein PHY40_01540 [Patescibacteria group bacterium]|nr:hypothetical protein [Patescibacteria group bacterium]